MAYHFRQLPNELSILFLGLVETSSLLIKFNNRQRFVGLDVGLST